MGRKQSPEQWVVTEATLDFTSFPLGIVLDLWGSYQDRIRRFLDFPHPISPVADITWYQLMVKIKKPALAGWGSS